MRPLVIQGLRMKVRDDGVRHVGTTNKRLRGRDSTSHPNKFY